MMRASFKAAGVCGRAAMVALALASVLAMVLTSFLTRPADAAEPTYYNVTGLDPGWSGSIARDINDLGKIAGQGQNPTGQQRAFLWEGDENKDLGVPAGGNLSRARSINATGEVVGEWRILVGRQQRFKAFLYADGEMKDLSSSIPAGSGFRDLLGAQAINDSGQIVGSGTNAEGQTQAYRFLHKDGEVTDLGVPVTDPFSEAWGINESGAVVGESGAAEGGQAFLYEDGAVDKFGAALDHSVHPYSEAVGINDSGDVIGWSYTPVLASNPPRGEAFLYEKGEDGTRQVVPLAPLPADPAEQSDQADPYSRARDIDESGRVVGWSRNDTGSGQVEQFSAVLWENGQVRDLNALIPADSGWKLTDAYAINESGQIVGAGFKDGQLQAFILTPDKTPPILQLPEDITAEATSKDGATVTYAASATDENPASPEVSCSHPSGSTFALSETTVTCTARDRAGNEATGTFKVTVSYSWSGVLQPVNADDSSLFKLGRTIPVKFELTGESASITDAEARIHLSKVSQSVVGTEEEASAAVEATEGDLFRYDASEDQYVSNLSTRELSEGTYRLRVDLGDGAATEKHTVNISLR